MAESSNWSFPEELQPRTAELQFDLPAILDAVVQLRAEIPEDAFTASILGTERAGSGIVIGKDGLILTIGYVITEASSIWITGNNGVAVAATPLAYDQVTGLGLVQPLGRLNLPALQFGSVAACRIDDEVLVVGHGGRTHALKARIIDRREFAGYWEYVLDEALFTAPAHPQWAGTAVVDMSGRLVGVGSLFIEELLDGRKIQGNMVVPIDLLPPILEDMRSTGHANRPARPWLGMYTSESDGKLVVGGLAEGGPAERAGVRSGDMVIEVAGSRVSKLAELFRKVWALGPAGTEIALTVARGGDLLRLQVRSANRNDFLKKPSLH